MGLIKYNTVDFNNVPTPEVGTVYTGYDSNTGKLTQKDSNGVITVIGMSADPEFNSVTLNRDFTLGPIVNFVHPSNTNVTDIIDTGLRITRGTTGWLFNPLNEGSHGSTTPSGTMWYYINSPIDFTFVDTLTYDYLENVVINNLGSFNALPTTQWIMHDTVNDKYHHITFITWQSGGGGGGFSYNRQLITLVGTGEIIFPDGTTMSTAPVDAPIVTFQKSYVTVSGNDATAVNYQLNKPYATIDAAVAAAVNGDIINVSPGYYNIYSNIFKDGVILNLEKGALMLVYTTISASGGGTFTIKGEGQIYNYVPLFAIASSDSGNIDVELGIVYSYGPLCFTFGDGTIKLKAKSIGSNDSNNIIVFGTSQLDFTIDSLNYTGPHTGIFIYNTGTPGTNYFYNFNIKNFINASYDYGALHMELTHETCFVNFNGNIVHNNANSGFMNGAITASGTSGSHAAIVRFNGNITTNQYGAVLSSAGLRVDMVGDIVTTGTRPALTIAGNNRPTFQLRGNISGSADDLINLGIVNVFTQSPTEGFFKHISGKILQTSVTANSIIQKEGSATELVVGGELIMFNPGFAFYTTTPQDVYSLNASTNGNISVDITTIGALNILTGVPEIDF